MVISKINILPYVAEYAIGKWWDYEFEAVRFSPASDVYHLVFDLMAKRPVSNPVDHGNLPICLPDRRGGKSPEQYNWFSDRAAKAIEAKLRLLMWAELHEYMDEQKHLHGVQYKDSVYIFLARYGIESITEDALLKNYQRWRDRMRKRAKRAYRQR